MKTRKKVIVVGGARPNFIKIAPLMREFKAYRVRFAIVLVHTGQHYDYEMSEIFFQNLKIPRPDIYLNVGSHSNATQISKIMAAFEKVVVEEAPDLVIVVGDVNSTLACSLVAAQLNVRVAHVEAGLRSFDRTMPEEINRTVTDSLSDYLFVSEESGLINLKREGARPGSVFFVGNVMIDTLLSHMDMIDRSTILNRLDSGCLSSGLKPTTYAVLTLHRPSNVDSKKTLFEIYDILRSLTTMTTIVYPIHPRARKMIDRHGFTKKFSTQANLLLIDPLGYIDFMKLVKNAAFVLTDSGGIQEETTVLGVPCLTMRENTERPCTLTIGTNCLVGRDEKKIVSQARKILRSGNKKGGVPQFWDGKAARRIVQTLARSL